MNKIRQLKNLLATKDARQLRKDGEALLKDLLYEYTGMGLFYSFGEVCERLHELLGD